MDVRDCAAVAQLIIVLIGTWIALGTYLRDSKLRRMEWIHRLYERFYENDRFKPIRRLLDHGPQDEIESELVTELKADEDIGRHEALVDYLNFFEFIAAQVMRKRLDESDVLDVFEYYLRGLRKHDFLAGYLRPNGFDHLADWLPRMKS
jgi:hypothetical protein